MNEERLIQDTAPKEYRDPEVVAIAVAVIARAVQDLTSRAERHSDSIRLDAYLFLTERLWRDDCVWQEILEDRLPRDQMLREVHRRVRFSNGRVDILKEKPHGAKL